MRETRVGVGDERRVDQKGVGREECGGRDEESEGKGGERREREKGSRDAGGSEETREISESQG